MSDAETLIESNLPRYHAAIDWQKFARDYPLPDVFERTVYKWPRERLRKLQNERFLAVIADAWKHPFYSKRWRDAGMQPGDIKSIDDLGKIPMYTSDDVSQDQAANPPFGEFNNVAPVMGKVPLKLLTSGGTTGKPRALLNGPMDWLTLTLGGARSFYINGARPGDVMQIPLTCSLATLGWGAHDGCREYMGILPITTGTGVVTPTRRQLEIAFDYGTNIWYSFPEYLGHLARVCRDEIGRDIRELDTKLIATFLGPDLDGTLRRELEEQWGCPVYDRYGTHEFGLGGFECREKDGLHWMEDMNVFEICDVETGAPLPSGEAGTLVVTSFTRRQPPVIRYNVRDLARVKHDATCGCGSSFRRIDHFLGRADSMIKLRGVNVYPMACTPAIKSDPRTTDGWICIVEEITDKGVRREEMTVHVEVKNGESRDGLQAHLEKRLREDLGVSVPVKLADEGELREIANIGKEGKPRRLLDKRAKYAKKP
jgi:phenylacetate-CoA ligase